MAFSNILKVATAVLLCSASTFANPIERRAVDSSTYANLQLFEQFAAAAYCGTNNEDPNGGQKLTCPTSNNCPLVEADDVVTVLEFENSLVTDVTGYIAVDNTRSLTILAFRGSRSLRNYVADVNFPVVETDICSGCTVNAGFYQSWLEARTRVLATLKATAASHPSYKVVVVGHSLGGAIAAIAAAELRNGGTPNELYTYGAPRIGKATVSTYITNQGGNFRVTHYDDPVPRLPPLFLGYVHISPEYYISTGNNVPVTPGDITKLTGSINVQGNTANFANGGLDLEAHGWYFNKISACDSSDSIEIYKRDEIE